MPTIGVPFSSSGGEMADERSDAPQRAKGALRVVLRVMRENLLTIVLSVALLIFVYLLQNVLSGDIRRLDGIAYQFFVVRMRRDWLTPIMQSFTSLSSPIVLTVMLVVVAAFAPGRMPGRFAMANLVGIVVLNYALKEIVQRPRPEGFRLIAESGYSFPSGHSMVAVAFYGFMIWLIMRYEEDAILRWVWSLALFFAVVMIGISRVYLGVHYLSDVIAGYCVAAAWLVVFTRIIVPAFLPKR